jgi:hypothetical protein
VSRDVATLRAMEEIMELVSKVDTVAAHLLKFPSPFEPLVAVTATGEVPTTGWTDIRLSPRYYAVPPRDGFWDFELIGDPPGGIVGTVVLPVVAHIVLPCPKWCTGVRVHAHNSVEASLLPKPFAQAPEPSRIAFPKGHVIVQQHLASYDDSIQPTGRTKFDPWPHFEMKKLHHDLVLIVSGPDEAKIRTCINQAIAAGLLAAIIAAISTFGAALPAAISAFIASLEGCLGNSFSVRIENQSHWEYWWT